MAMKRLVNDSRSIVRTLAPQFANFPIFSKINIIVTTQKHENMVPVKEKF